MRIQFNLNINLGLLICYQAMCQEIQVTPKNAPPIKIPHKDFIWEKARPNGDAEYIQIFSEIGLAPELIAPTIIDRAGLLRLAMVDGNIRMEFLHSRKKYDNMVAESADPDLRWKLDNHPLSKRKLNVIDPTLWSSKRDSEYDNLYQEIGIPAARIPSYRDERRHIESLIIPLQEARLATKSGRTAYLNKLRENLTKEAFETYRIWELNKPVLPEYENFLTSAPKIPQAELDKFGKLIVDLLREANVFQSRSMDGPFDEYPSPISGRALVAMGIQKRMEAFKASVIFFNSAAELQGLPPNLLEKLNVFFDSKLKKQQEKYMRFSEPEELFRSRLMFELNK